jgi:hypothetical protein
VEVTTSLTNPLTSDTDGHGIPDASDPDTHLASVLFDSSGPSGFFYNGVNFLNNGMISVEHVKDPNGDIANGTNPTGRMEGQNQR